MIKVHTNKFEASHGRSPRGRGTWTFQPRFASDADQMLRAPVLSTFADAKRWLRSNAIPGVTDYDLLP